MGRQPRRSLGEEARSINDHEIPEHLRILAGPFGPYAASDRIEWHHLSKELQECLARMSKKDVADFEDAVSDFVRRRTIKKWAIRIFWGATTGFGAVYVAGERLLKLLQYIGGLGLDPTSIGRVLKGLIGL